MSGVSPPGERSNGPSGIWLEEGSELAARRIAITS